MPFPYRDGMFYFSKVPFPHRDGLLFFQNCLSRIGTACFIFQKCLSHIGTAYFFFRTIFPASGRHVLFFRTIFPVSGRQWLKIFDYKSSKYFITHQINNTFSEKSNKIPPSEDILGHKKNLPAAFPHGHKKSGRTPSGLYKR